jgi:hypothetical protein
MSSETKMQLNGLLSLWNWDKFSICKWHGAFLPFKRTGPLVSIDYSNEKKNKKKKKKNALTKKTTSTRCRMECKVSGIINRLKKKGRHLPVGDTKYASSTFICLFILHHYFTLSSFFFCFCIAIYWIDVQNNFFIIVKNPTFLNCNKNIAFCTQHSVAKWYLINAQACWYPHIVRIYWYSLLAPGTHFCKVITWFLFFYEKSMYWPILYQKILGQFCFGSHLRAWYF